MVHSDFHVHTNFCDGKNTPVEMIESAIDKGVNMLGVVAHSYLDVIPDNSWCLKIEDYTKFIRAVGEARNKYKDKILVLIGLEQDYYSPAPNVLFDFIIGAVHVLEKDGKYYSFDESEEEFCRIRDEVFGGDIKEMYQCYYRTLAKVNEKVKCNIIGHFDLIGKYNDKFKYFNEVDEDYIKAYESCIDEILERDPSVKFEINTGCIYRGARGRAYPCFGALDYLIKKDVGFVLSSDAHDVDGVAFELASFEDRE